MLQKKKKKILRVQNKFHVRKNQFSSTENKNLLQIKVAPSMTGANQ